MKKTFTKHFVKNMDASMIQKCIYCGAIINDYRNIIYPSNQQPPRGFGEGAVFISNGNPIISTIIEPEGEEIKVCKQIN